MEWSRRAVLASSALGVLAMSLGCANRRARIGAMTQAAARGEHYHLRVHTFSGRQISGWLVDYRPQRAELVMRDHGDELVFVPLSDIDYIEFHESEIRGDQVQAERNIAIFFGVLLGIPVALFLVLLLIIAVSSCPFVYVVDPRTGARRRVGEAYAGAIVASLARQDVMALPDLGVGRVELVLTNEAPEVQYTDVAELWWADHPAADRVVPTPDGRLLRLGPGVAAVQVEDLDGADQTAKLGSDDPEVAWATQLLDAIERDPKPHREGLVARFAAAPDQAVVELVVQTTPWLDRLSLLGWASLSPARRERVQADGRDPDNAGRARELMELGGVYARIEVREQGIWREVVRIPPAGWVAPRRIAIPLDVDAGAPVEVRISGGVGFLVVHDLRLASAVGEVQPARALPVAATQSTGEDELARLSAVDGDPNVLDALNEEVALVFELPEVPEGAVRTTFLRTHGYYEVKPPKSVDAPPIALKAMKDPERFSAYGLEIFEELHEEYLAVQEGQP